MEGELVAAVAASDGALWSVACEEEEEGKTHTFVECRLHAKTWSPGSFWLPLVTTPGASSVRGDLERVRRVPADGK